MAQHKTAEEKQESTKQSSVIDPGRTPGLAEGERDTDHPYGGQRSQVRSEASNGHAKNFSFVQNEELIHTLQQQFDSFRGQFEETLDRFGESWSESSTAKEFEGQIREIARDQNFNKREVTRWASMIGGGLLAFNGLRRSLPNLTLAGFGAALFYWGWSGESILKRFQSGGRFTQEDAMQRIRDGETDGTDFSTMPSQVTKSIIVKANVEKTFGAWADFENFPHFMQHIESVTKTGDDRSHWIMRGPFDQRVEWDAKTTRMEQNKRIAWNSMAGSAITTSGQVTFNKLPDEETEVTVTLQYLPPAGMAGEIVAQLFGDPEGKLGRDLRNFKRYIEQQ